MEKIILDIIFFDENDNTIKNEKKETNYVPNIGESISNAGEHHYVIRKNWFYIEDKTYCTIIAKLKLPPTL